MNNSQHIENLFTKFWCYPKSIYIPHQPCLCQLGQLGSQSFIHSVQIVLVQKRCHCEFKPESKVAYHLHIEHDFNLPA